MEEKFNCVHGASGEKAPLESAVLGNNIVSLAANNAPENAARDSRHTEWVLEPEDILTLIGSEPPPIDYLFEGLLPSGIVAGLCGSGGVGKSTFIAQLSYSLSSGITVFPSLVPAKARRVMILLGEDPREVTWRRIHNIAKHFPPSPEEQVALNENLHLYCMPARPLCQNDGGRTVASETYRELQREIGRVKPDLIIMDPKSRWAGTNENSNDDATMLVTMLEDLIRPNGASLLLTHHVSKSGKTSLDSTGVRGASALVDGLRLVFVMAEGKDDPGKTIALNISKSNMTPKLERPIIFAHSKTHAGVLEEVVDCDFQSRLEGIVEALVEWFSHNEPIAMTALILARTEAAKELHDSLKVRFKATKKDLSEAIALGVKNKVLVIEKVGKRGRPAEVVSAALANGAADNVVPFNVEDESLPEEPDAAAEEPFDGPEALAEVADSPADEPVTLAEIAEVPSETLEAPVVALTAVESPAMPETPEVPVVPQEANRSPEANHPSPIGCDAPQWPETAMGDPVTRQ